MSPPIAWPEGKRFAFTVFDDADYDFRHLVVPVYDFLAELGVLTTKSIWPLAERRKVSHSGSSAEDSEHLAWAMRLKEEGFEIGFHGARCHSSEREDTILGLERFRRDFGYDPKTMSNHYQNVDSIYWGAARLSGIYRHIYNAANLGRALKAEGHIELSPYFWGDLCKERVKYVRNFVFRQINTLNVCPIMPYYDERMPWVNAWFASAEGGDVESYNAMLVERNQDKLAEEGGACIMYTHFAKGFCVDGQLDRRFVELMKRLVGLGGWFVPVGELLDYLSENHGGIHPLSNRERAQLQRRWLWTKLRHGSS